MKTSNTIWSNKIALRSTPFCRVLPIQVCSFPVLFSVSAHSHLRSQTQPGCSMEEERKNDRVASQPASSLLLHVLMVLWLLTLTDWQNINTSLWCLFIPRAVWQNWFIWKENYNLYWKMVAFQIEVVKIVLYWILNGWDRSLCISLTLLL